MTAETRRDVFQAIADPTRRKIIDLIAREPMNVTALSEHLRISRPAVSQQLRVLEECGLISIKKEGRETFCTIRAKKLKKISDWAGRYARLWEEKIDRFDAYVNQLHHTKTKHHGTTK